MLSSSRGKARVRVLAVHTTEGMMRAAALRDWKGWTGSSHASADETGALLTPADGFVPYDQAAWTLRSGNAWSENIELCGWARWTREEWLARPKLLEACARWLADRSRARGIPLVKLSPAEYRAGGAGVIGHVDHTLGYADGTHTDPGKGFPYDVVLARARAIAGTAGDAPAGGLSDMTQEDEMLDAEKQQLFNADQNSYQARLLAGQALAKLDQVLAALPQIAEDASESRRMDGVQLGAIAPAAGEVVLTGATFDPAAVAASIKALGPALAADVASRLRITAA